MARFSPHSGRRSTSFGRGHGGGHRRGTSLSSLMAAGAVIWIVVLLGTTARGVVKSVALTRSLADLRAESLSVAASIDTLDTVLKSQGGMRDVEREARERFRMLKPGEIIYVPQRVFVNEDSTR